MEKTNLYIPKKCKVGLQLREGTYTGKLGYIIYHDGKVWRKEPSWENWRHKENEKVTYWSEEKSERIETIVTGVEPREFDNVPTEGFVLNKKAGGYSSGWNHRQTYCRVYDPRGWEFEISIPNLLYILQECSAYKGKGLEGELVYSWEGKDLVLLPVSSPDYKQCELFTDLQAKKVGVKDLVEGCAYLTSQMEKLVYLGSHLICEDTYYNLTNIENSKREFKPEKKHVFRKTNEQEYKDYYFLTSLSKIKQKISDDIDPNFADYVEELQKSEYYSEADYLVVEPIKEEQYEEIFDVWGYDRLFVFGEIKTSEDFEKKQRRIRSASEIDSWVMTTPKKVNRTSWSGSYYYDTQYVDEKLVNREEILKNYGLLYRVYKNGFKKLVY